MIGLLASLTRSRRARTGVVILALLIIAALLAPVISPGDPARIEQTDDAAAHGRAVAGAVTPTGPRELEQLIAERGFDRLSDVVGIAHERFTP